MIKTLGSASRIPGSCIKGSAFLPLEWPAFYLQTVDLNRPALPKRMAARISHGLGPLPLLDRELLPTLLKCMQMRRTGVRTSSWGVRKLKARWQNLK